MFPAISDADGPDARSYVFDWKPSEEADFRKRMEAMAEDAVHAYTVSLAQKIIQPAPAGKPGATKARHKPAAKATQPPQPVLDDVRLSVFDLWTANQPVLIFSAVARVQQTAPVKEGELVASEYYVTLVAKTDLEGNLRKLYSGVTDKYHLDITPRLDLIDAVDADGDGRGELLFRETSDVGSGYVIYRATVDTLWKLYDSLNPE